MLNSFIYCRMLLKLFVEIHYWERLMFEIPHYAADVYTKREDLRNTRENVLLIVRDYNRLVLIETQFKCIPCTSSYLTNEWNIAYPVYPHTSPTSETLHTLYILIPHQRVKHCIHTYNSLSQWNNTGYIYFMKNVYTMKRDERYFKMTVTIYIFIPIDLNQIKYVSSITPYQYYDIM